MDTKDILEGEERPALTIYGQAISAQMRDNGRMVIHVKDSAVRSLEDGFPIILESHDVLKLHALLNEADSRDKLQK